MPTIGRSAAAPVRSAGAVLIGAAGGREPAADRRSRVFPAGGERLLHADLHNHTLLSDGDGRPEDAFASMRAAGLDIAAITDHATVDPHSPNSIDADAWQQLAELADAADEAGAFVALRGFEWSSPSLGHMNVWGSAAWTNPIAGTGVEPGASPGNLAVMAAFHEWLRSDPGRPGRGGGRDALVGFNHPGRETGRFGGFVLDAELAERVVSLEMFNRGEDYLFEHVDRGRISPLVECLDAGWRVGLLGVTDEHGTDWGFPTGLGRGGLWTYGVTRSDVRAAMSRRRFFATRERNLRVDASARSVPGPATDGVPMGARLLHDRGDIALTVDVHGGPEWTGRPLRVQVLQTGRPLPTVVDEFDLVVPVEGPIAATTSVDRADGDWIVLRLTDPVLPADPRAVAFPPYASAGSTVAYASPFFLGPAPARRDTGRLSTTALDGTTFGLRAADRDQPA